MSLDEEFVEKFIKKYDKYHPKYWIRGTKYQPHLLQSCDTVVIFPPNNRFKTDFCDLPSGVLKELKEALKLKKNIGYAYKLVLGDVFIYKACVNSNSIEGIYGTSNYLSELYSKEEYSFYHKEKNTILLLTK